LTDTNIIIPDIKILNLILEKLKDKDIYACITNLIKPNISTLEIAYKIKNNVFINDIIDVYKIIPNKICLDYSVSIGIKESIKVLNFKICPDEITYNSCIESSILSSTKLKIISLLVEHGLKITPQMFHLAMNYDIILDIKKYGLTDYEYIYYICHITNNFPSEYIKLFELHINRNILKLRNLSMGKKISINKYLSYIIQNKIYPDRYCLESVCYYNPPIANFLIDELKCEPSIGCLRERRNKKLNNKILNILLEKYDHKLLSQPYNHIKLDELNKYIKEDKKKK
jgi:hypothetical protein